MTQTVVADLQQLAKDHLWMHFTRMSGYRDSEIPVIVRGDGCYLEDVNGKRYLDALGEEGWEVTALHPLVRMEASYVILKRPKEEAAA